MNKRIVGYLEFKDEIIIKDYAYEKPLSAIINGISVKLVLPRIKAGKLYLPCFSKENCGTIYTYPKCTCGIKGVLLIVENDNDSAEDVYLGVENWLDKFSNIYLSYAKTVKQEPPTLKITKYEDGSIDFKTELSLYEMLEDGLIPIHNPFNVAQLCLEGVFDYDGITLNELQDLLHLTSSINPVSQVYFLLANSVRLYMKSEYSSSIFLCSVALEVAILTKLQEYYLENGLTLERFGTLGKKFQKLAEHNINIPIDGYKEKIINVRNEVIHSGKHIEREEAIQFLNNCKIIIQTYCPNALEKTISE